MMLNYRRGQLYIENVPVELLIRSFGTPLYVYSRSQLLKNYQAFDTAFGPVPHLVCYALKANSNGAVLKALAGNGAGVDITSGGELFRALKAGFPPRKIVYAGIGKTAEEIDYALEQRILMFNVESLEELEQINRIALKRRVKAPIAFRINPNVDPHTHHYITTGKSGGKFGIPYNEAVKAYQAARRLKGIDIAGIHCHIGSQITEVAPFLLAARKIESLVRRLSGTGIALRYVDLGGGLGITYDKEAPPTPAEMARAVLPVFKGFGGTFVFEPGRCIVGNAGVLVAKVVYRKRSGGKNFLIVDTGMNDLIRPTLYEAYHGILPARKGSRTNIKVDVVGPICETGDFLGKERSLPWLSPGEHLVVKCAGAYGFAMSSQYNSRLRAAEVMVQGKEFHAVRRRETYPDLTANEL
ncbi:MAG: diaminopimelate decarboxylase [Endomicrobiales bacterium]